MADFDVAYLAEELAEVAPNSVLVELIKMIDAFVADVDFTFSLLDMLADSLSDDGFTITIGTNEESK